MRTTNRILLAILFIMFLCTSSVLIAQNSDNQDYKAYKGIIVDKVSQKPLLFANISLKGANIATVSNAEGEFIIKIPENKTDGKLEVSYIGYKTASVPLNQLNAKGNVVNVEPTSISLNEINIRPDDPFYLVRNALYKIPDNYSKHANKMKAFYRESVQKRNRYVSISEAVLDIYKAPYNSIVKRDLVRISKGRKNTDTKKIDTVIFKVQGGPNSNLLLDVVKNPYVLLDEEYLSRYDYKLDRITKIDNRLTYVVGFKQKKYVDDPLFYGQFYIDMNTMAITAVEFDLNLDDPAAASQLFIRKKPVNMHLVPLKASYMVTYKEDNEKWYFNYARCDVKFKCKWKKKLFNTVYSTSTEMAITDREENNVERFAVKTRLNANEILTDKVNYFIDDDFWGDYNTIEPEQSIQNAIDKIGRKMKHSAVY